MEHPYLTATCRKKLATSLPTVLLYVETAEKSHGSTVRRWTAHLWPGVSCDQALQDQCVPLPNRVNALADVVLLHHACLPSMDDLGLCRSCREERAGKEGNKHHPSPLCPLLKVAASMARWKSHLLRRREEPGSSEYKTQRSQEILN